MLHAAGIYISYYILHLHFIYMIHILEYTFFVVYSTYGAHGNLSEKLCSQFAAWQLVRRRQRKFLSVTKWERVWTCSRSRFLFFPLRSWPVVSDSQTMICKISLSQHFILHVTYTFAYSIFYIHFILHRIAGNCNCGEQDDGDGRKAGGHSIMWYVLNYVICKFWKVSWLYATWNMKSI